MHVNLDPLLVDKIANEVKSQGVFDQFRKDSMADVDTKPAYQNLRQRVENTVNKFLSAQIWTPDMNKNQLREKLRKHITEAGFLDVGVERIVDQVVNPKIATVFQPKIEDIAYKYLGIPKPQPTVSVSSSADITPLNGALKIETNLLPTDLEQVSPDSDKCTVKSDSKDDMDVDDKMDDFESPAFEPIESSNIDDNIKVESETKCEDENELKTEAKTPPPSEPPAFSFKKYQSSEVKDEVSSEDWDAGEQNKKPPAEAHVPKVEQEIIPSQVSPGEATQESQLSQVSSDGHLSIVTNGNTQDDQSTACDIKEENNVNISEEAQMPKFSENSNSCSEQKPSEPLHFDIKKDEIKFEGTERKTEPPSEGTSPNISDEQRVDSSMENKTIDTSEASDIPLPSHEFSFEKDSDFKFSKIEVKVDLEEVTKTTSLDDSADRELQIIEKSELSQCSMSQASMKSPMVKPKSPSATSSPMQSQHKSSHRDRDHSSSSSRHKKYSSSKDKRSDKDKVKHSSSSHHKVSSSSSRHHSSKSSSSQRTPSSDRHHHHHRSSSSSVHKSKSSSSSKYSKSSRSHHDSKESSSYRSRDRDRSRERDRSKSNSDKTRDKMSKEKSERTKTSVDDHYSSKQKWRKSTDSNDEDSSQERSQSRRPKESSSNSLDNTTNGAHNNNSNTSSGTSSAINNQNGKAKGGIVDSADPQKEAAEKILVADDLIEHPEANPTALQTSKREVDVSSPTSLEIEATLSTKAVETGTSGPDKQVKEATAATSETPNTQPTNVENKTSPDVPKTMEMETLNLTTPAIETSSKMEIEAEPPTSETLAEQSKTPPTSTLTEGENVQTLPADTCPYDGEFLFYFENETKTKENVDLRLNQLTHMMENFRHILKTNLFSSGREQLSATESESSILSPHLSLKNYRHKSLSPSTSGKSVNVSPSKRDNTLTSATLTIDCIEYDSPSMSHCLSKRFKFEENSHTKVSPTPSELSANSKENEFLDKNSQSDSDSLGSRDVGKPEINKVISSVAKRKAIVNRNQRYSSEDLYKPRPILSQRSKRRGLDAVI